MTIHELIDNYITAHNEVAKDREEEELYLNGIIEALSELYPELEVTLQDGYITIGSFTTITIDELQPLIDLNITNFHIDTHLGVKTSFLANPSYYHNLMIHIDIDKFNTAGEFEDGS